MENNEIYQKISDFLKGVATNLNCDVEIEVEEREEGVFFTIVGKDASRLIGHRGESLDALQTMATALAEDNDVKRIYVDAENYRDKRRSTLTKLALRLAEKAHKTGRKQSLEPMNPYERRIIHFALAESEYAETVSEGEGKERHVVIVPKNYTEPVAVSSSIEIQYGKSDFSRTGFGKTRSFGKKRRF